MAMLNYQRVYEYMIIWWIYVYVAYVIVLRLCTCTYVWICVNVYEKYCGDMDSINTCMICIYVPAPTNPSNLQCIAIHTTVMHHIPQVIDSKSSTWEIPRGIYRICDEKFSPSNQGDFPQKIFAEKQPVFPENQWHLRFFPWNPTVVGEILYLYSFPFDFVWERATRKKKAWSSHVLIYFLIYGNSQFSNTPKKNKLQKSTLW